MLDNTVQLHVSTGSARYDHALAEKLLTDIRAHGIEAESDGRQIRFPAESSALLEVVLSDISHGATDRTRLALGDRGGIDTAADSRTVVDGLKHRGLLPHTNRVYSEDEEAEVARRLEELGYLG